MTTSGCGATADAQLLRNASSYELHNVPPWFDCSFHPKLLTTKWCGSPGDSVGSRLETATKGLGLDPDSVSDWPALRFLTKAGRDLVNTAVTDKRKETFV